jgi:alkanesulfonate monooxygenase SsuD/methylene tetrahydromethanopterin reductase-like flavin-dependent oxidoreductase (luciferase family)
MKIGIQLPEVERQVAWPELKAMSLTIESAGFDSIWVGDHLLYRDSHGVHGARGPWEAWSLLAAIAAITDRVEMGPLVAATPFHAPAILAKKAATVDEISGGRLVLGLGAGWNRVEFDAFGFPYDQRVARFTEAFEIIRRLLAGERFDYHGRFHHLEGAELAPAPRPGSPRLMIGSNGPRMLAATLPHVHAWNSWYEDFDNDPGALPTLLDQIDRACAAAGRDPATLSKTVAVLVQFGDSALRRNPHNPIRGTAAELAEAFARFEMTGIDHLQLVLDPITLESIESAAEALREFRRG